MTFEELNSVLEQAEEQTTAGRYEQADLLAQEVIDAIKVLQDEHDGIRNDGDKEQNLKHTIKELQCKALLTLSNTARLRGDFHVSLTRSQEALSIAEKRELPALKARAFGNIGSVHHDISDYTKALEYYDKALRIDEELGNKAGVARHLGGIGVIHAKLSDFAKTLEFFDKALRIDELLENKEGVARHLGNIGLVHWNLSDNMKALEYYGKALSEDEEIGNKAGVARHLGNIGIVYKEQGDYQRAQEYYLKALHLSEEIGAKWPRLHWLESLGRLYFEQQQLNDDPNVAEKYLRMAISESMTLGVKHITRDASYTCYQLYKLQERWEEALSMKELHDTSKEDINIEEVHKQETIRQAQKEIEIAKATADAKHQATTQLLHNVLPPSIASKMLDGTTLIADRLLAVSVLFADIVDFTKLSQRVTPEQLVEGLDRIFSTIDTLVEKHGLEKIKTIGDAYMVVSGAPIERVDHAEAMARFALELMQTMRQFHSILTGEKIQLRIGIHSGEVVAGVIGKKKFSYDLWGDAVNIASRMESHGESGRIHVSEEFERAVQAQTGVSRFHFSPRGEIEIKGKGTMKTYFLERE